MALLPINLTRHHVNESERYGPRPCRIEGNWTRRQRTLTDLDIFNRTLAVMETAAHLELLAYRGDLTVTEHDRVRPFAMA